jgi:hypothetical protein
LPKCRKPDVNSRQNSPAATEPGISVPSTNTVERWLSVTLCACSAVITNTSTLMPISAGTTTRPLVPPCRAPPTVRAGRTVLLPSFTQSTHW